MLHPLQQYHTIIHPGSWATPSAPRVALSVSSFFQFLRGKIKARGINVHMDSCGRPQSHVYPCLHLSKDPPVFFQLMLNLYILEGFKGWRNHDRV